MMVRYTNRYPDGLAGSALLLLRLAHAVAAVGVAQALVTEGVSAYGAYAAAGVGAACLLLGLATRWVALAVAIAALVAAVRPEGLLPLLLSAHAATGIALAMMGAGAYSIDARRHGRRVIEMPPPDRGAKD